MAWPSYVAVEADGQVLAQDPDVRRTSFEDGAVRQEPSSSNALWTRRIRVLIDSDADLVRFRAWAAGNAASWFAWTDSEDGVKRRVRVRGGAGAIVYRALVSRSLQRNWRAELVLEGLLNDVVQDDD